MNLTKTLRTGALLPIKVNLIGGNVFLSTHKEKQIELSAGAGTNPKAIPNIYERSDFFEIREQKLAAFLPQREKIVLNLKVPEGTDLTLDCFGGAFEIYGKYNTLGVNMKFGEFRWYVSAGLKEGNVRMWAGDMKLFIKPEDKVNVVQSTFGYKEYILNEYARLKCAVHLGDIRISPPTKDKDKSKYDW